MKLSVVNSIKIDSKWRKKLFVYNLMSLEPIFSLLSWRLNIVGKYADFCRKEITSRYKDATVTSDDDSSYYQIVKDQIQNSQSDIILFWEEDNWFLCPEKNLFLYLLSEFKNSQAELLSIGHMIGHWERKPLLSAVKENYLYKEYRVDSESQKKIWAKFPGAFIGEITGIYKKHFALEILEFNKPYLVGAKNDYGYELDRQKGEEFLKNRSFIDMVPTFQVFREVFKIPTEGRAISIKTALLIMKLRREKKLNPETKKIIDFLKMTSVLIPRFGPWPEIIRFGLPSERILKGVKKRILWKTKNT